MFKAAYDGCLPCVRYMLENEEVDVNSVSPNHHCNVLDWARYGLQEGNRGAANVIAYLEREYSELRVRGEASGKDKTQSSVEEGATLDTPVRSPAACHMMEKMGWKEGQALGARGDGIQIPLRPVQWLARGGLCSAEDRRAGSSSVFVRGTDLAPEGAALQDGCFET